MRDIAVSKAVTLLLSTSLLLSGFVFAQEPRDEIRPRRVQPQAAAQSDAKHSTAAADADVSSSSQTPAKEWQVRNTPIADGNVLTTSISGTEPLMRIALATDVRSASVSTNSHLLTATDLAQTFAPLDVARVRIEARLLSAPPPIEEYFSLRMAGLASRAEAEKQAKLIREATSEQCQFVLDVETQTWGLLIGPRRSRESAEIAQMRLEDAGFAATVVDLTPPTEASPPTQNATAQPKPGPNAQLKPTATQASSTVRTTSPVARPYVRLAAARSTVTTRELIASSPTNSKLFSSSAPVLFASDDEAKAPVRFNDKPYRGRIEVFANTRGLLTVVNVIGLEDYVRGVVANELSPGGWPALEALKAQAIAARTYALRNRGQFLSQGFDLLPTTRSQVYRGLSSEQSLSTLAVEQTRGLVATYAGQPINALYTSTCGGRTEDARNIFNEEVPYLHAHECSIEGRGLGSFTIKTGRELADLKEEQYLPMARMSAELAVHGLAGLPARISDSWLAAPASAGEVRTWLATVASWNRQALPSMTENVNRPPEFATALSRAVFGESRADTLLNNSDVEYFLAIRDADDVPAANRADVALLVRDGYLSVLPDLSLRPREALSHARVLRAIARLLESRNVLQLQKGTTRPATDGTLILRLAKGKDQPFRVSSDVYLFRQLGDSLYPVRSVALVGGEAVTYHVNSAGSVDYLEVRPATGGAAADRFSPFSNWTNELSPGAVRARLGRAAQGIGSLVDLRVASRGSSRRVTDLEVIGTDGIAHVRGGRIRSALGLREQLFVIDRKYDTDGKVAAFIFTGRGWGHGVGMCQVGAYGLARQGMTYAQILKTYYTGIEITKAY